MTIVKGIDTDLVNISLLIGVENLDIEEHIKFLYEIVSILEHDGKLNDEFTKLYIKHATATKLSFVEGDVGESLKWMVANTKFIEYGNKRSAGAEHYRLVSHPWVK